MRYRPSSLPEFQNFDHETGTYRYYLKNEFFPEGGRTSADQYMVSVWMFNIKFVLLFGEIPTNYCLYFRNDIFKSDLLKSYVKGKA